MSSIFDLEQKIMDCWKVVDDIDELYHYFGDDPLFTGMSGKAEDEQANLLLGLHSLYSLKFENMWKLFEQTAREYHKRGKELEQVKIQLQQPAVDQHSYNLLEKQVIELKQMLIDRDAQIAQLKDQPNELPKEDFDFAAHEKQERADKAKRRAQAEWPEDDDRVDVIGQNGNDGLHYADKGYKNLVGGGSYIQEPVKQFVVSNYYVNTETGDEIWGGDEDFEGTETEVREYCTESSDAETKFYYQEV